MNRAMEAALKPWKTLQSRDDHACELDLTAAILKLVGNLIADSSKNDQPIPTANVL